MIRSALKRKTWLRTNRKPIAKASKKRKAEEVERAKVRKAVLARDGFRCQAAHLLPAVPCRLPLDVHEVIPRSAWPGGQLVVTNAVTVCRGHHEWIGDHPAEAHALGLHGFSWERPARFPYPGSRP